MISLQELFGKIISHLRAQNAVSLLATDDQSCAYRGLNGLKCAVGCLISDEEYDPKMENNNLKYLMQNFPTLFISSLDRQCKNLMRRMQLIHDATSPEMWENSFQEVAQIFDLIVSPNNQIA